MLKNDDRLELLSRANKVCYFENVWIAGGTYKDLPFIERRETRDEVSDASERCR